MIITLTLNPAVDKTIEVNNFKVNTVNRVSSVRIDAGGKGINVSKVIHQLGEESIAMGILAGKSGEYIQKTLNDLKITNDFLYVDGETRTNLKIVDRVNRFNTDINEKGPSVNQNDLQSLLEKLLSKLDEKSVLVLSGSVPGNLNGDIYRKLIKEAKAKGARTILDADGELFVEGIKSGPYLIKPNINELENYFKKTISSPYEAIDLAKEIFNLGVEKIVVSLGAEGAIFMTKNQTIFARGIKVQTISTVGAGDSMVAAMAMSIKNGYSFEKMIRLAMASSAACVMKAGTEPGDIDTIREIEKRVDYQYL